MRIVLPIRTTDVANGDGVRVTIFVTGCRIHCPGCFNQEAQSFDYGEPYTKDIEDQIFEALDHPWIAGLTILGGEPFEPENQKGILPLLRRFRQKWPLHSGKTVWIYTGYEHSKDLLLGGRKHVENVTDEILSMTDILVDGPFIEAEKDISLQFRGSRNQRILHLNCEL